jgi:hypothetical protein
MSELKLITPRRNFLIRALRFTAAGATLPISIITADDAKARIVHHQTELGGRGGTTMAPPQSGPMRMCDRPELPMRHMAGTGPRCHRS